MTEQERDNILFDLQKGMKRHDEKLENLQNSINKHNEKLENLQNSINKHDEKLENLQNSINKHDEMLENLHEEVRNISQSVAVIEHDHGEKLQVLLDIYPEFYKKFASFAKNFVSNDHRFDNLEARVYSLESKAANQ